MNAYPISLIKLDCVRCIIVGGGSVAERKVGGLLDADARPVVISPDLTSQLIAWREADRITHHARPYAAGDLQGATLAIAATNNRTVNALVAAEAHALGILINVADDPDAGNFHTSAVVRRGNIVLTAATGGASPALSALIRRTLEATFGPEYAELSAWLDGVRHTHGPQLAPAARTHLYRALATDDVLGWLRAGERDKLEQRTNQLLATLPKTTP